MNTNETGMDPTHAKMEKKKLAMVKQNAVASIRQVSGKRS